MGCSCAIGLSSEWDVAGFFGSVQATICDKKRSGMMRRPHFWHGIRTAFSTSRCRSFKFLLTVAEWALLWAPLLPKLFCWRKMRMLSVLALSFMNDISGYDMLLKSGFLGIGLLFSTGSKLLLKIQFSKHLTSWLSSDSLRISCPENVHCQKN